jgi:hypothetical protein
VPHIHFAYSRVYEEILEQKNLSRRERVSRYLKARAYIAKLEKLWRPIEGKVFSLMSDTAGIAWQEDHVICYAVHDTVPFADPLTVPMKGRTPDYFIDTMVHELLHRLLGSPDQSHIKHAWEWAFGRWRKESFTTQVHIPLYAIHALIYLKLFGEDRLRRDMKKISKVYNYRRAWDIVLDEGPELLVAEWKRRVML